MVKTLGVLIYEYLTNVNVNLASKEMVLIANVRIIYSYIFC